MDNNELKHYGVLGMKWGKRKARYDSDDYDDSEQDEIERRRARNKKIAIAAIGTIATVAVGAAVYKNRDKIKAALQKGKESTDGALDKLKGKKASNLLNLDEIIDPSPTNAEARRKKVSYESPTLDIMPSKIRDIPVVKDGQLHFDIVHLPIRAKTKTVRVKGAIDKLKDESIRKRLYSKRY